MTVDLSRISFDPDKRYASVRMQQGRVLLDADWNEQATISIEERVETLTDVIGPSGTSDEAFRVGTPTVVGANIDFPLGGGTFYIGGHRLPVEPNQTFQGQLDQVAPVDVAAAAGQRHDLVWLESWEQPVTAIEDREIREVGLGGPDTTARTRLISRVRVRTDVGTDDCGDAWHNTVGQHVDVRGRLTSDATATITYVQDADPDDLCAPEAITGYLRHDNQAIRAQVTSPTTFAWAFDNAAPLYRVEIQAGRQEVIFTTQPLDEAHRPRSGQVVELLPWGALLSNGEKIAEPVGVFGVVGTGYDPDDDSIVLSAALPVFEDGWLAHPDAAVIGDGGTYVYLRVWDRGDDPTPPEITFAPGTAVALGTTGLRIEFNGTQFRNGDHWIIAARPAEPTRVMPWELWTGRRAVHGPHRMRAPLALIDWRADGTVAVEDCRRRFRSLTELQGCCEYSVGDGEHSFGDFESIQAAIAALPEAGGRICVNPGIYEEHLNLRSVNHVEIHGCGNDVRLVPGGGVAAITIDDSTFVNISGMHIETPGDVGLSVGHDVACFDLELTDLGFSAGPHGSAIDIRNDAQAVQSARVLIRHCEIDVTMLDAPPSEGGVIELWPAIFTQCDDILIESNRITTEISKLQGALGGMQVGGLSSNVTIRNNRITGGNGHGIVVGSIHWEEDGALPVAYLSGQTVYVGIIATFIGRCLDIGIPTPPGGDGSGPTVTPVSDGLIEHLLIEHNVITRMAGDGIGVVRYFLEEEADIIGVEHLRVRDNEIMLNRTTDPPVVPASLASRSGHGGIALGAVADGSFERNRISMNGSSSRRPVCGIFMLLGSGVSIVDNLITANGFGNADGSTAQIGRRGGVVILLSTEIDVPLRGSERSPRDVSALRVIDNIIDQPIGQALSVIARGRVVAHGNQFSAGILPASEVLRAVFDLVGRGDLGDAILLTITHLVGSAVSIINLGLPIDPALHLLSERWGSLSKGMRSAGNSIWPGGNQQTTQPPSGPAPATPAGGSGGADQPMMEVAQPTLPITSTIGRFGRSVSFGGLFDGLISGGHVLFNDNQVMLDMIEGEFGFTVSSVLIASLDDVAVHDNQMRCVTDFDIVLVDAICAGLNTVRFSGNRCQELPHTWFERAGVGFLGTQYSFATLGLLNITTSNHHTNERWCRDNDPTVSAIEHNFRIHP